MSEKYVHTSEINELGEELRRNSIVLTDNSKDPKVNRFLELLSAYANNLFIKTFPIKDKQEREDVAQKACISAIKSFDKFDPDVSHYSTVFGWICRSCQSKEYRKSHQHAHLVTDANKKRGDWNWFDDVKSEALTPAERLAKEEGGHNAWQKIIIEKLLISESPLDQRQKEILKLRVEGLSYKELAEKYGVDISRIGQIIEQIREAGYKIMPYEEQERGSPGHIRVITNMDTRGSNWMAGVRNNGLTPQEILINKEQAEFSGKIVEKLLGDSSPLSARMKEVLQLQMEGLEPLEIAGRLDITHQRVSQLAARIKELASQEVSLNGHKRFDR